MRILIIGGTVFLGRHLAEAAQQQGHQVTLFHRGKSNPGLFPEMEHIYGDRNGGLGALKGKQWDAVIDTCGYFPRVVRESTEFLADKAGHYTFISSISVYENFITENMMEDAAVGKLEDATIEEVTGETYGPLKALCEKEVEETFQENSLVIRPGLIVGPYDPTDRFTYWVERIAEGGEILIPDMPDYAVQFIDVRDLAEWIVEMVEKKESGVYNATGPKELLTFEEFFATCKQVLNEHAKITPIPESFLIENEVGQWMELPLWVSDENMAGFLKVNCEKAVEHGLTFRNLEETVTDTYKWSLTRPKDIEKRAGMTREREKELLENWADSRNIV